MLEEVKAHRATPEHLRRVRNGNVQTAGPRAAADRAQGFLGTPGIAVAIALLVLVSSGGAYLLSRSSSPRLSAQVRHHPKTDRRGFLDRSSPPTAVPTASLRVVSVWPGNRSEAVAWRPAVTIRFSEPVSADGPMPSLSPAPPGTWSKGFGDTLVFRPRGNFAPLSKVTLAIPGGAAGVTSTFGTHLSVSFKETFRVAGPSWTRLNELLAELGYLPVRFLAATTFTQLPVTAHVMNRHLSSSISSPTAGPPTTTSTQDANRTPIVTTEPPVTSQPPSYVPGNTPATVGRAPAPPAVTDYEPGTPSNVPLNTLRGSFVWRFRNIPVSLAALWDPSAPNAITTGAVMAFELDHGLATDGMAGPEVWRALLAAVAHRDRTNAAYDYVYVSTTLHNT